MDRAKKYLKKKGFRYLRNFETKEKLIFEKNQ